MFTLFQLAFAEHKVPTNHMPEIKPLNVIVPLAGEGSRFASAGFFTPKPLVRANGHPVIMRSISALKLTKGDTLVLAYHRSLDAYNFRDLVRNEFPELQARFVPLACRTRGPAETVLLGSAALTRSELSRPTLVVDGDSIYRDNVVEPMRRSSSNIIFFFEDHEDHDDKAIYSYISLREDGSVSDIQEKVRISKNACIGAYGFESAELLRTYCKMTIDLGRRAQNEFYVSGVYNTMLEDGLRVEGYRVDRWECLGTPLQLRRWAEQYAAPARRLRICFDLDNTLVSHPGVVGDYESCSPIDRNVRFLRFMKEAGHYIIIHTSRPGRTCEGDRSAAIKDIGDLTKRQLDTFAIPYDELVFGKPHADMYVDGLAVLPQAGLEQQTGFYMESAVEPRSWHSIKWLDKTVRKTGPARDTAREAAWYRNLPNELSDIAPRLIGWDEGTIEIERVAGIPMSQLHVSGLLSPRDLGKLLATLDRLHAYPPVDEVNVYANYAEKIDARSRSFDAGHLPGYATVRRQLLEWADDYAARDLARKGLIHGDPVFTNVIVTPAHEVKLIDPRGEVDGLLTHTGDILYDYGKVYQSLIGYDAILQEVPQPQNDALIEYFRQYVRDKSGEAGLRNVTMIAASLLFSLIPLHRKSLHADFLELSRFAIALVNRE